MIIIQGATTKLLETYRIRIIFHDLTNTVFGCAQVPSKTRVFPKRLLLYSGGRGLNNVFFTQFKTIRTVIR